MLNFGMRQLNHFIAVAEAGSYRAAAERIFIAQPALSISIKKLEQALELSLFERGPRGVTLTTAGEAFLKEARQCIQHAEKARETARFAALGEWGVVRLGFVGRRSAGKRHLAGHRVIERAAERVDVPRRRRIPWVANMVGR